MTYELANNEPPNPPPSLKPMVRLHELRDDDAECEACGYSMRGLPRGARCPECGAVDGRKPTQAELAMRSDPHRPAIGRDVSCPGCGYDLRGMVDDGVCPECGMAVSLKINPYAPLSTMPIEVVRRFRNGCVLASACVLGGGLLNIASMMADVDPRSIAAIELGVSLMWLLAVCVLTPALNLPQAVMRGFAQRSRLRQFARWLQLGWVVSAAATLGLFAGKTHLLPQVAIPLISIGALCGLAGVVVLAVMLERLADWVYGDLAQRMFNWTEFLLPACFILGLMGIPLLVLRLFVAVGWAWSIVAFIIGLLSVSRSVTLSVGHSWEYQDRMRNRAARSSRETDAAAERVRKIDEAQARQQARERAAQSLRDRG